MLDMYALYPNIESLQLMLDMYALYSYIESLQLRLDMCALYPDIAVSHDEKTNDLLQNVTT